MQQVDHSHTWRSWQRIFEERMNLMPPLEQIPRGPKECEPVLADFLAGAALCERLGFLTLSQKAELIEDEKLRNVLLGHAAEIRAGTKILVELGSGLTQGRPTVGLRIAAGIVGLRRPLQDQLVATLMTEASAVAIYQVVSDSLAEGRAAEGLRVMADDHRLHVDFWRDLAPTVLAELPEFSRFALRSLRTAIAGVILALHSVGHRRYLEPLIGQKKGMVRRRLIEEHHQAFSGLPGFENLERSPSATMSF